MRKCKYHPFIDDWITKVERGKVHSCKEMKQLMPVIRAVLDDHNVEIRAEEIEDCVKFSEEYFFELYDAERTLRNTTLTSWRHLKNKPKLHLWMFTR